MSAVVSESFPSPLPAVSVTTERTAGAPPASPRPVPTQEALPAGSPARILVVEDNLGDARVVVDAIRKAGPGAVVEHVADAEAALERLETSEYDVIIVDQGLPGMSGLELGEVVHARHPRMAQVMLTGAGHERLAVQALKGGFDDYVVKDVTLGYRELLPVVVAEVVRRQGERDARERAERALKESEERYSLAVQGANDAIWDWDLRADKLYLSPRWTEMLGQGRQAQAGDPAAWLDRVHPEDLNGLRQDLEAHLQGLTPHLQTESRLKHANGTWRWMLCRGLCVRDESGKPLRLAGSQTDITERRLVEERLLHDALHDPLTGLSNRAHFMDRLRRALRSSKAAAGQQFGVIFLDLDDFKTVNDSLGHLVGDQLLIQLADRLRACTRPGDTVARFGGDEFAILLETTEGPSEAEAVAQRVRRELSRPFEVGGRELFASASIGIAGSASRYERAEDIIRDADTAMYRAKADARSSYRVFEPSMHVVAASRLELESDLHRALKRGELQLHYQPVVSLNGGRLMGFEALIRWAHPERGMVSPEEFIPAAEENGLILPIGHFTFEVACRQLRQWQRMFQLDPSFHVAVNLSATQFGDPELLRRLGQTIVDTGVTPSSLRLEMTESAIVSSEQSVAAKLWQLRSLKVGIALDDFGTGYSSLSYLRHFPIDALKVDRSFVRGVLADDGRDATIVRMVVQLAGSLGMDVVAEGVETREQLDWLREVGCPCGQGYFFSKALDPAAATQLIHDARTW